MSNFEKFFNEEMKILRKPFENFPWEDKACYGSWLAQTYHFVSGSTRILAFAASMFQLRDEPAHLRFLEHLREEKGHEKLLSRDLKGLGFTLESFAPLAVTSGFYQAQYYWVMLQDPITLLGYVLALEGLASQCGTAAYETVMKKFGKEATTFLKVHSGEDPDHVIRGLRALDSIPEDRLAKVKANFEYSSAMYRHILDGIVATQLRIMKKAG